MSKAFNSQHAFRIWDNLYTVLIPDQLTMNPDYIKRFGVRSTGDADVDRELMYALSTVMIPIAKIVEYFEDGFEVQIPSRKDMITMHKDIELYLDEWRDHIKYDINISLEQFKPFILSLEKLSKLIYDKAKRTEVIDTMFVSRQVGLVNPLQRAKEQKEIETSNKPNYSGISDLVRKKNSPSGPYSRY